MVESICIYGVPGVGKTTISETLSKRLGWKFLELDYVRPLAQKKSNKEDSPFLFEYTTSAWQRLGHFNEANVINGFIEVRRAFTPFIQIELNSAKSNFVAEAAFLNPALSCPGSVVALIAEPDYEKHYNQFFVHRNFADDIKQKFEAARYIQKFLVNEARRKNIIILENNHSVEEGVEYLASKLRKT